MRSFSEFAKNEGTVNGKKIKISEIIGETIAVTGAKIIESKYKGYTECLLLQFEFMEKTYMTTTGSKVLIRQIKQFRDNIPFKATIINNNNCFTFS